MVSNVVNRAVSRQVNLPGIGRRGSDELFNKMVIEQNNFNKLKKAEEAVLKSTTQSISSKKNILKYLKFWNFDAPGADEALEKLLKDISREQRETVGSNIEPFLKAFTAEKETSKGTAIYDSTWGEKDDPMPVVFAHVDGYKNLHTVDNPFIINRDETWKEAIGFVPSDVVGFSSFSKFGKNDIKECNFSNETWKKIDGMTNVEAAEHLSKLHDDACEKVIGTVLKYFEEAGIDISKNSKALAFLFSFSNDGIDKVVRKIVDNKNMNSMVIGPYRYANYLHANEVLSPSEEFPLGAKVLNFPYNTLYTAGAYEVDNYAFAFSKIIGELNQLVILGGREHGFNRNFLYGLRDKIMMSVYDIMKEVHGIEIKGLSPTEIDPRNNQKKVLNAAALLNDMDIVKYGEYDKIFDRIMPDTPTKKEIEHPALKKLVATMYTNMLNNEALSADAIGKNGQRHLSLNA